VLNKGEIMDKDKEIQEMVTEVLSKKFEFTTTTTPRETKIQLLRKAVEILENTGVAKGLNPENIVITAFPLAKKLEILLVFGLPDECKEIISEVQIGECKEMVCDMKHPITAENWKQAFSLLRYCEIGKDIRKSLIDSQSNN
jgi:hypothetical protein